MPTFSEFLWHVNNLSAAPPPRSNTPPGQSPPEEPPRELVLFSGQTIIGDTTRPNYERADLLSRTSRDQNGNRNHYMVDETAAGRYITDNIGDFSQLSQQQREGLWSRVSERAVQEAVGNIVVFAQGDLRADNTFVRTELGGITGTP
jgi:hypothetical protein